MEAMNIGDVVKRIDVLVDCNSLGVRETGDFVEFLFGGGSTGIGVSKVNGGYVPYREIRADPDIPGNEPDIEYIGKPTGLEEACCRAFAEILVEELELD